MTLMKASSHDPVVNWIYADVITVVHTSIILMERKILGDITSVSQRSLASGRTVLNTILDVSDVIFRTTGHKVITLQVQ